MMRSTPRAQTIKKNAHRNLRFGWWSLLVFLSLGGALETLHGFKIGWYVDVGNETRRLMFTLAHAHGTLLALINIAAGLTARNVDRFELRPSVSFALIWAAILLPAGFFLGGIVIYDGDPGLRQIARAHPTGSPFSEIRTAPIRKSLPLPKGSSRGRSVGGQLHLRVPKTVHGC